MTEKYTRKPNTSCVICKKEIYKRPIQIEANEGNVFCGQKCYGIFCRKEKPCIVCGEAILASLNKKTCSRACSNKNRSKIISKESKSRDKVKNYRYLKAELLDARGSKCERCGYSKAELLEVHHKDRDRSNNTLKNLELVCPNCHTEEHYLKNSWLNKI